MKHDKRLGGLSKHGQLACLLVPPLLTLLILFVAPISLMAVYGFWATDENYLIEQSLQLTQYEKIAHDPLYLGTLASSAGMALDDNGRLARPGAASCLLHCSFRLAALARAPGAGADRAGLGQRADPHLFLESGDRRVRPDELAAAVGGSDR